MEKLFKVTIYNEEGDMGSYRYYADPTDDNGLEDLGLHIANDLTGFIKGEEE